MVLDHHPLGLSTRSNVLRPSMVHRSLQPPFSRVHLTNLSRLCIITSFTIYVLAGREIFRKRQQLRSFGAISPFGLANVIPTLPTLSNGLRSPSPLDLYKTTEIQVTSEIARPSSEKAASCGRHGHTRCASQQLSLPTEHPQDCQPRSPAGVSAAPYEPYSVIIERGNGNRCSRVSSRSNSMQGPQQTQQATRVRNVAMEANTAAWGYTKCCILFFISLLVTWVRIPAFPTKSSSTLSGP